MRKTFDAFARIPRESPALEQAFHVSQGNEGIVMVEHAAVPKQEHTDDRGYSVRQAFGGPEMRLAPNHRYRLTRARPMVHCINRAGARHGACLLQRPPVAFHHESATRTSRKTRRGSACGAQFAWHV